MLGPQGGRCILYLADSSSSDFISSLYYLVYFAHMHLTWTIDTWVSTAGFFLKDLLWLGGRGEGGVLSPLMSLTPREYLYVQQKLCPPTSQSDFLSKANTNLLLSWVHCWSLRLWQNYPTCTRSNLWTIRFKFCLMILKEVMIRYLFKIVNE